MKILAALILFITAFVNADEMHKAAQFYQAGEFDQAIEIYNRLLKEAEGGWEKAVLRYNLGCAYFSAGQNFKAVSALNAIRITKNNPPLLIRNIKTVLARAYIAEAKNLAFDSIEAFSRGLFYLWEAQEALQSAETAECLIKSKCLPSDETSKLREEIALSISHLYSGIENYWINHANLREGINLLTIGIQQILQLAEIIDDKKLLGPLSKVYTAFFKSKGEEWIPLWVEQEKQLASSSLEVVNLFSNAKKFFVKGLENGEIQSLEASNQSLGRLISILFGKQPLYEQIQKLLTFYQTVLLHEPLQLSMLASLEGQYKLLPDELNQSLSEAKNLLYKSYQAVLKGDPSGRLYLLNSYRGVELLARRVRPSTDNQPRRMLEDAIEDERYAIIVNRQEIKLGESGEAEKAQKYAMSNAEAFYSAVKIWQDREFHKEAPIVERCQYSPWDEVLPLFNQGLSFAAKALEYKGIDALPYQEQAFDAWKESLHQMDAPRNYNDSPCKGAQKERKKQTNEASQDSSFEQVASQIIRMEEADRSPQGAAGTLVNVERPW